MNPEMKNKCGLTLIEILVVVAVIAILVTMVISVATRIDNQGKEKVTVGVIEILNTALEQFNEYDYNYQGSYSDFEFPLDCNDFFLTDIKSTLEDALGTAALEIIGIEGDYSVNQNVDFKREDAGCQVMCFFLNRLVENRKALEKINSYYVTNEGTCNNGTIDVHIMIRIDEQTYPFYKVIDAWGKTMRYDYYDEQEPPIGDYELGVMKDTKKTFPVITSAGPDKEFGTPDDISNR